MAIDFTLSPEVEAILLHAPRPVVNASTPNTTGL